MKAELVDVTMTLHREIAKALLVSDDGEFENAFWLPKSLCETEQIREGIVVVTLPEWKAREKGLI